MNADDSLLRSIGGVSTGRVRFDIAVRLWCRLRLSLRCAPALPSLGPRRYQHFSKQRLPLSMIIEPAAITPSREDRNAFKAKEPEKPGEKGPADRVGNKE